MVKNIVTVVWNILMLSCFACFLVVLSWLWDVELIRVSPFLILMYFWVMKTLVKNLGKQLVLNEYTYLMICCPFLHVSRGANPQNLTRNVCNIAYQIQFGYCCLQWAKVRCLTCKEYSHLYFIFILTNFAALPLIECMQYLGGENISRLDLGFTRARLFDLRILFTLFHKRVS